MYVLSIRSTPPIHRILYTDMDIDLSISFGYYEGILDRSIQNP
jgi:hypothetical protein